MKNILIIPCATQIAVEQYNSLKYNKHFNLIGASHNESDKLFKNFINLSNPKESKEFIQEIIDIINLNNIDVLLPSHDDILYILKNIPELSHLIPGNDSETINICRFKSKTYNTLISNPSLEKYIPKFLEINNLDTFFKPDRGQGSRGSFQFQEPYLMCEYLPGEEYTIDCFTDSEGEVKYVSPRWRSTIENGISEITSLVLNPEFSIIANNINKTLPFNGAWFFQMKKDINGDLKFLEVAPRIAGASSITRLNGVNLTSLTIYQHLGYKTDIIPQDLVKVNNRQNPQYNLDYDTIFLDYDDTYPFVIEDLKQLNKSIKIITRHKNILDLPYEIIYVKDNELKSDIINYQMSQSNIKPIFIDDSFREKKDVLLNCKIPCISLEEVLYLHP
jgi:hypothetical protein